ncbi:MAG: phosphoribosylanthranilate isomerase [Ferruginibacter sp.]
MNIKVCGITTLKQLQQLDGLGIDYAGLIFYENSPRSIIGKVDPESIKEIDFDLKKVGVFVDAPLIDILDAIDDYGLEVVQLHGNESPEICESLSEEVEVIKAFSIDENTTDIDELLIDYDEVCDFYLFDTKSADTKGGTGKKFDWKKISKAKIEKPFFLSGGISVDDIAAIKAFKHPDFLGIDVNSKFEKEPGVKDMGLVLQLKQHFK